MIRLLPGWYVMIGSALVLFIIGAISGEIVWLALALLAALATSLFIESKW